MKHYVKLENEYGTPKRIYEHFNEELKNRINNKANDDHYKFQIYKEINPNLVPSPFLKQYDPIAKVICKFRLGSHRLPIETGRWRRIPRNERLCGVCGVLGDEKHFLFECNVVSRDGLNIQDSLSDVWSQEDVSKLFERLKDTEFL